MIQLSGCSCIRKKIIEPGISFSEKENFNEDLNEIYVAPCSELSLSKYRFGRRRTDLPFKQPCECLELNKGRCNNCKTRCFIINHHSLKLKMTEKSNNIDMISLDDYLKTIKSMLFFSFCKFWKRIKHSLVNPS